MLACVAELPMIISVDDHVVEPADVWMDRLPAKYQEVGPRIVRAPMGEITFVGGKLTVKPGAKGAPTDWWYYEELRRPLLRVDSAVGVPRDEVTMKGITYEDMRPGSYQVKPRLEDMDANHLEASLCFPTFPRFCGQTFYRGEGQGAGPALREGLQRLDGRRVVRRVRRPAHPAAPSSPCGTPSWPPPRSAATPSAASGPCASARSPLSSACPPCTIPTTTGIPSSPPAPRPDTVVNMHIGSSSKMPSTSADAPPAVGSTLAHTNATFSMVDFLFSGVLVRFPDLKLAYSEGQIGWIPYILERADNVWEENRGWGGVADNVPEPPSTYFHRQIYGCFFDDAHGLRSVDEIGVDNITYESDYPHSDSTWPHTREIAERQMAHLDDETRLQDRPRATPSGSSGSTTWRRRPAPDRRGRGTDVDLRYSEAEETFRIELRAWLAEVLPTLPPKPSPLDWPARRVYDTTWQRMLFDAGYAGIDWPVEGGGRGASPVEQLIYLEELERAHAPYVGVNFVGLLHAGPTIVVEGTPSQRARFLPPILRGDEVWCQGFSEPGAGSDLASLRTRAVATATSTS